MADDLKAVVAELEAFGRLVDRCPDNRDDFTVEDSLMRRVVRAQRALLSERRKMVEALTVAGTQMALAAGWLRELGSVNAAGEMIRASNDARRAAALTGSREQEADHAR